MLEHEHGIHDETWKYDKTQHWQECSCGEKLNVANHIYGDWKVTKEATETEVGSRERGCTVCEYVQVEIIPEIGHEHGIHDETWKYDETDHWQECSCGEKLNVANHTYGDWKVTKEATETEAGSRERGCAVCEYVQTEAIPATETGEPTDSTDPTDSSDSQGQQDPSGDTGRGQQRYGAVDRPDAGLLRRRAGNAALQAEKGGGREIRLRDKTKPAKAPAGGLRAKSTARPGAAGIFFKKGYPFYKEEKYNASKKETDGVAAFPVYGVGSAANDRFCGECAGCSGRFKAGVDKQRFESQLEPAGTHRRAGDL